ncbi:hypothetical protein ACFOSC_31685 [Streptantibioticus rubrisoli]|uniref:Chaplin n=1 Tax=Streptantibioticus rubrisoli TaxID=1387313 RepID=A0ABT1P971_9ACTN|nr:hypothetical protein [Streptantibioticus rubrisoli]MCQ4041922.1 hypothetical protein [Streptantibioticus rubrisoli]
MTAGTAMSIRKTATTAALAAAMTIGAAGAASASAAHHGPNDHISSPKGVAGLVSVVPNVQVLSPTVADSGNDAN